jgi:hypothetical protein
VSNRLLSVKEGAVDTLDKLKTREQRPIAQPLSPKRTPSAWWYLAAVVIAVGGLIVGAAWGFSAYRSYQDRIEGFSRIGVPGQAPFTVTASGERVIYFEGPSSTSPAPSDIRVTGPDGSAVAVQSYAADLRYDAPDGSVGRAVATFAAPMAGAYNLIASGPVGVLAIGEGIPASTVASILGALTLIGAAILVGLMLLLVTRVRRSKS